MLAVHVSVRAAGSEHHLTPTEHLHCCRRSTDLAGGAGLLWAKHQACRPARLTRMLLLPGDGVKQLMWRLQHGELPSESQHHPKVVVVHVGTNGESICHFNPFLRILNPFCKRPAKGCVSCFVILPLLPILARMHGTLPKKPLRRLYAVASHAEAC